MRIMLDTNAYSAFKRGDIKTVEMLAKADEILVPTPVLGELRAGFKGGSRESVNIVELEAFLASRRVSVHALGEETALFYAEVLTALRSAGTPVPTNDLWIAAAALESGSILLTHDAHFKAITGLVLG